MTRVRVNGNGSVTTGNHGSSGPSAASQAEVDAGTVPNKYVSPLTLTNWSGRSSGGGGWPTNSDTVSLTGSPTIAKGSNNINFTGAGSLVSNANEVLNNYTPFKFYNSQSTLYNAFFSLEIEDILFLPDTRRDPVGKFGFNINRTNNTIASLWDSWEAHYDGHIERIFETVTTSGGHNRNWYWFISETTGNAYSKFTVDQHDWFASTSDSSEGVTYLTLNNDGGITSVGAGAFRKQGGTGVNAFDFSIQGGAGGIMTLLSQGGGNDARMVYDSNAGHTFIGAVGFNTGISAAGTSSFTSVNITGASMKLGLGPEYTVQYITAGTAGGAMDFHGPDGYYFRFFSGAIESVGFHRDQSSGKLWFSMGNFPTSNAGLPTGTWYNDGGTVKIA